jgi:carbamoyl-phosphate synthase large subunit
MNLLVTCVGRRCELIDYFRKELNPVSSKVIAVDITEFAPALYHADKHYILKKDFDNLDPYVDQLIDVCKKENATHIITLIDPEMSLFVDKRRIFEDNNIQLILSSDDIIEKTFDKYKFYLEFKDTLNVLPTCDTRESARRSLEEGRLKLPLIAKPRCGSSSIGLNVLHYLNEFQTLKYNHKYHYIFQERFECKELGLDVYFDMISGKVVSVFMKEKVSLRSGETDKAVSVFREDVLAEIKKFEAHGGFRGPIDMDIFIGNDDGKVVINEINPRFGGGYPMGHNCGVNFMKLILNNMRGVENQPLEPDYKLGVKMMKHNQLLLKDGDNIYSG